MNGATATTSITGIGRVLLPVSDQDRAIEFYVGKLGFEKRADIPYGNGERWVEVAPSGAATAIALVSPRGHVQTGTESRILLATADIDADHGALRERGVDIEPEVSRMGDPVPPMVSFRDPDGNGFMLVETA